MPTPNIGPEIGLAIQIGQEMSLVSNPKIHIAGCKFSLQKINRFSIGEIPEAALFSDAECNKLHDEVLQLQAQGRFTQIRQLLAEEMKVHNFPSRLVKLAAVFADYFVEIWSSEENSDGPFIEATDEEIEDLLGSLRPVRRLFGSVE